ncbi:hypothetical protein DFJ77DRAFT_5767 [Powellomyces hirtus]|nr:hypothetical protein DFJ77DRAFT_5767 [Powellomyces hirtus]
MMMARLGLGGSGSSSSGKKRKAAPTGDGLAKKRTKAKKPATVVVKNLEASGRDGEKPEAEDEEDDGISAQTSEEEEEEVDSVEDERAIPQGRHDIEDMRSDDDDEGDGEAYFYSDIESDDSSEDVESTLDSIAGAPPPPGGPQVVVFQDATRNPTTPVGTSYERRSFMSSDIKKLAVGPDGGKKLSKKEATQEVQDQQHDRDLAELIRASKLVEQYTAAQLTGNDRRKYMASKVAELGGHVPKTKTPRAIQMGMDVKERERGAKRLQDAKDLGIYHSSLKTQIMGAQGQKDLEAKTSRIKERVKHRSRGIDGGFGSFKNGTLHIGKEDFARVEKMDKGRGGGGRGGRGGGGGRGRGRGRGGGRGGASAKKPTKFRR